MKKNFLKETLKYCFSKPRNKAEDLFPLIDIVDKSPVNLPCDVGKFYRCVICDKTSPDNFEYYSFEYYMDYTSKPLIGGGEYVTCEQVFPKTIYL